MLPDLVGFNLRIAYNRAVAAFGRQFSELAMAPIQFAALEFVSRNPGTSQKEIANRIDTRPSVLVGPLERLEQRGWIVRRRSVEDRRRARVFVTDDGAVELARARELIGAVETAVAARFEPGEREELVRLLKKISDGTDLDEQ